MLSSDIKFKVSDNVVFRKQEDGSYVLLQIEGEEIFELDEVSAHLWGLIVDEHSVGAILEACEEEYEDFGEAEEQQVLEFINELLSRKVLELVKA